MRPTISAWVLGSYCAAILSIGGCASDAASVIPPMDERSVSSAAATALQGLYTAHPSAKQLAAKAHAILVFPDVTKGGFIIGGQMGNGVLLQNGKTTGYYNLVSGSYGWQAGVQQYGYALFLMNPTALERLNGAGGWDVGLDPSVVVVDAGMARNLSTTSLEKDVYAFIFNQTGVMAGAGLQGSKITQIQQ